MLDKQLCTPSPMKASDKFSAELPPSKNYYHLGFGSLKKFTRGNPLSNSENCSHSDNKFLGFFSSSKTSEKKSSSDIVPTSQFKTYKKVKESANGGLQLGATSMINSDVSDMYLADNSSILSGFSSDTKKKVDNLVFHDEIVQGDIINNSTILKY